MSLALLGGKPIRTAAIPSYNTIGAAEKEAVQRVMDRGVLSGFYGSHCDEFYGGPEVQAFEKAWSELMQAPHVVSMNSATSGLFAAVAAVGIEAGDEVIVSPYTMSATAAAILAYRAIPVFADIDPEIFCLDPKAVEKAITPKTTAIIVTHLFGHPADMVALMAIAQRHQLKVIEDCAQSPGALALGQYTGLAGDVGVFSLNCHKIIQCGEGGVCVTREPEIAKRLQLVRNHGEAVIAGGFGVKETRNLLGFNYRLTEIQAAIGREQLKKLMPLTAHRQQLAQHLNQRLHGLPGITVPVTREGYTHGEYVYSVLIDEETVGIGRNDFAQALSAEGFPVMAGYMKPLYEQRLYQEGLHTLWSDYKEISPTPRYGSKMCPVTESVEARLLGFEWLRDPLTTADIDQLADAFEKIVQHRTELSTKGNSAHAKA